MAIFVPGIIKSIYMLRKYFFLIVFSLFCITSVNAQYQSDWQSLDKKPIPEWYKNAKFGIFIHWGVYSVPAFSKVGGYAEWYQHKLRSNPQSPTARYQREVYGNQNYYDLAKYFKAQLFDPDAWAQLFQKAGAKYVVLTSKHHDGFTLWPSKEADRDWGFPWNATEVGPHQDLIRELFTALRKTDVKPGLYYSLYEWYNPLYLKDVNAFVEKHTIPQMKDLINNYRPYLLWTDGGWDHSAETWQAQKFLAWLYNDSRMKDSIVTFDRWGSGVRFHHGMVYTPEYQPGLTFGGHYFEESQGMGYSYGYNRAEDISDYSSGRLFVLQLIDIVSRGGNFLLDIGPRADGKIPPVMQERLLHIGQWLAINGEAIYGTRSWKVNCQWSSGKQDYKARENETLLLKQTVDPEPGYAVKEIFFTHKGNNLYCILPQYPDKKLVIKNINLPASAEITFLAAGEKLNWENKGSNIEIHIPPFDQDKIKVTDAYVIKIANAPGFVSNLEIKTTYKTFTANPVVSINTQTPGAAIHYTLDGGMPTMQSPLYTEPFSLRNTATVKAIAFKKGWISSRMDSALAKKYEWHGAMKITKFEKGIRYRYYEPEKPSLETIKNNDVVKEGIIPVFSLENKIRKDKYAFYFSGYIKIDKSAVYTFYTTSDDGSDLWIDGEKVVDNGGPHGALEKSGKIALKRGIHSIKVRYFDGGGGNSLDVEMKKDGGSKKAIPADILFH